MARFSRLQIIAATSIPIAVMLLSLGLATYKKRSAKPVRPGSTAGKGGSTPSDSRDRPRLAVTSGRFDAMGKLLDGLGAGYAYETIEDEALRDLEARPKYDAIFLTCAEAGAAGNPYLGQGLRDFVSGGGTLYASDLRFDAVAAAFPEFVDPTSVAQGLRQEVRAVVASPDLRAVVGPEVPLHFELDGWRPAAFRGVDVDVLIKGKFKTTAGVMIEAPLLVRFPLGKGTVLFTSFHHAKRNSPAEIKLLNHLALKAVLARLESREVDTMADDGLEPQATTAIEVDPGAGPRALRFDLKKAGSIRFRLGFEGAGARMRLEVLSPTGKRTVKRGDSGVTVNILDASQGRWEYRLVAEEVPYPRFPALLVVGSTDRSEVKERANPDIPSAGGNVLFEEVSAGNPRGTRSRIPRIAVSDPPIFDDMGGLLAKLGQGFQYEKVTMDDLLRPESLDGVDIFFLTCSPWPGEWALDDEQTRTQRKGVVRGRVDEEKMKKSADTVRRLVMRGGTLYASDLRMDLVNRAFPRRSSPFGPNERVLPKMKPIRLDVAAIPKVMTVERRWLDEVAPSGHVDTVYDTLKKANLSPGLKEKLDHLVAAVELSELVKGNLNNQAARARFLVGNLRESFVLPMTMTDADVAAVAKAMSDWEARVRDKRRSGVSTKMKTQMAQTDADLKRQRNRMILRGTERDDDQVVDAYVEDPGLRDLLGVPKLGLAFNAPDWEPARFKGDVTVLLRGDYRTVLNTRFDLPLLVKFREGQGTVIFTSFHNEVQNSKQEEDLLRYLVFTAVTAEEETKADATMLKGGFSPVKKGRINHMAGNASITRTYKHPGTAPLRFALIFRGADARLKLTLVAPNGQTYDQVVESTLIVEASGAPPGEWTYTVEAVKVPYENFPFGVSIGEGAAPTRRLDGP